MGVLRPPSLRAAASQQNSDPEQHTSRARNLTCACARSRADLPQSVGAIDLGRQASRDLTSEAMKPREAA